MSTPGMRTIRATCKICKQDMVIEAAEDCPAVWIHKLTSMIVCDSCVANMRRYCPDQRPAKPAQAQLPINMRSTHPDP